MTAAITFSPVLAQIFDADHLASSARILLAVLWGLFLIFLWAISICGSIFLIHFFLTLPMRRAERGRLFLDLIESALNRGQAIEEMILSLAVNRDRTVGVRFHLLAAHIENGLRFGEALEKVPRFLPLQISAMLHAGEKLGDIRRVLPAGREILRDHPAGVRSAVHYMLLVVLFFSPVFVFVAMMTMIFVVPRFKDVAAGMKIQLWPETKFVFGHMSYFIGFEIIFFLFLLFATLIYAGGPQFCRLFQFRGFPIIDWIAWRIPWKQKRLHRTFSAMLAVLLDGGVPEVEAVRLAGDCTANELCRQRVRRIVAAIEQGTKLDEAVRIFDDAGEFHWRLTNAAHARGGFLRTLRGWHESLDAKAFQQEEATAHIVTSGLVILNGVFVALIATAMFGILVAVLNGMLAQ
jgi:type II secretory pathway component PulF